jgi:lipopolysaccharide cholinephosphotransferase
MRNVYLEQYREEHLRATQMKMLHILDEIVKICDRHEIPYWLDGGTLLGAARHGGFIPWDDDADMSMKEADLKRFVEVAPKELPPDLMLQTSDTDPGVKEKQYKVRDLNSFFSDGDDDNRGVYQKGVFVDIFPFVNYPSRFQGVTKKITRSLCVMNFKLHALHYYSGRAAGEWVYFGLKKMLFLLIWQALQPFCKKGEYTCSIPYSNWYGTIYRTADLFPLGTITFEGHRFKAPCHVDAYLTSIYHDWRQLPPKEKRAIHSLFFVPELVSEKKQEE